ncbi:protoporphyrinogen oxidase HemJ [Teichococcus aestuarii]|uniref:Protoporphyrinogen IX oxidase n=1 Tax=Teichococcus aestuarii TaxID=568898 RepID=A0A2U1V8D6_9PROT|nr:protoporphyrinogen oxidase HemJ [Pseudoroseomonas aestuarii]PWC30170.1 TIGR00701 family protein [Pseudoroseomonas aestuarii]
MDLGFLAGWYPWTKSLHLLSVFAWMAGLFYLPRLYVYHTPAEPGSAQSELFKVMERRLLRGIMNPAMISAWIFGVTLVLTPGVVDWSAGWWHGKLAGLLGMTWFHHHLAYARKAFVADARHRTERYWRAMNEVPTVLLILIVIMVIVKPF